ncbi:hypothetical protein D2V08_16730 [Flagellimonas lutimaris]|jgi:hypothetical protein|uniref:Uncharacterized protein n=1 Tax=Flagellimonas lutimaris TaxID=475082 RepID=A0A3A1N441_9FLAO|nr:hypothetical protein [Allomuricauda lutimaris]RIV30717.1 hypothetical protein D2V08_16730 [Allomuricauda lutimaris]|tara:strand:+ start:91 stop:573 length:483 start_codon:yes stop_codon:yes gene_type:complete
MNTLSKIITWKRNILASMAILVALVVLSFYGVYTNQFYFFKPDNYIVPILTSVHFIYLYVVWFKIVEDELPDPKMRNIEYALYTIMIVYFFKIYDSAIVLNSVDVYGEHVIPATFKPMAALILVLYCVLPILTLYTFWLRKRFIGVYNFENYNDNLNIWQ